MVALVFRRHFAIIVGLNEGAGNDGLSMFSLSLLITLLFCIKDAKNFVDIFGCLFVNL